MKAKWLCFAGMFVVALALAPQEALAQDCDSVVVDQAGAFGGGFSRVEAAAQELANAGAVVRVRTVTNFGGHADLAAYEAAMEARCASWRAPDGGTRNNLIALIVSYGDQRDLGLWYGTYWKARFDGTYVDILSQELMPRLRDGDSVTGFVSTLGELKTTATARPAGSGGPTTVINEKPTDLTGLWWVLGGLAALLALCLLVYFVVQLFKARAAKAAAQQKAKLNKTASSSYIAELQEPVTILSSKVDVTSQKVSDEDAAPLKEALGKIQSQFNDATARFGELGVSATDPDRDGRSTAEYEQIASAFDGVLQMLNGVRKGKEQLEKDIEELKKKIGNAPETVKNAASAIENATVVVSGVSAKGFKTDGPEATLAEARACLGLAETALDDKCYAKVFANCAAASAKASEAAAAADALAERRRKLIAAIAETRARIDRVIGAVATGRRTFEEISSNYAEACWSTVAGNGTEAENRVEWSQEAVAGADDAASMERQEWQEGEDSVAQVKAWLDEAESFMRSIASLKTNLEAAKREAQPEIDAAQTDIDKARLYIAQYDADIRDSLETDLREAQKCVTQAREELAKEQPDYIQVVKLARASNAAADKILDEAQQEHEAAERKRQREKTLMREAERSISAAKEYIEDHASDVDADAGKKLEEARKAYGFAMAAADIDSRITYADDADKKADNALEMAKSDVSDAEEARARKRRAAAARAASSSSSSSGWGTSSSFPKIGGGGLGSSSSRRSGGSLGGFGGSSRGGGSIGGSGKSSRGGGSLGGW